MRLLVSSLICLTVGLAVGWNFEPADAAPAEQPLPVTSVLVSGQPASRRDPRQNLPAIRAIVHEELASVREELVGAGGGDTSVDVKPAAKPPAPEVLAARRNALETIEGLVGAGIWGDEQERIFRRNLVFLNPEQLKHAMDQYTTSLNHGVVHITEGEPPL